ncbi:MAG: DUF29 family protein [Xenococcus sp. MO_188.B8]|nr:DUF29 family protein [Xenococcus sp. MO_188.B8]
MTYDIDKDYDLWLQEQANFLRSHSFEKLDIKNLIEELEALVRGEKKCSRKFCLPDYPTLVVSRLWSRRK